MVNKNLIEFGRRKAWHQTQEQIFGLFEGYQCSISGSGWMDNPRQTVVSCMFADIDIDQRNKLFAFLDENKKKLGYKEQEVQNVYVLLVFNDSWKSTKPKTLDSALTILTTELKRLNIQPGFSEGHTDFSRYNYYNHSGLGIMLQPDDYEAVSQEINRENKQRLLERTSYISGVGGALLYALPVIIVWVLVAYFFNIITSIGGIIISLAAYYGYDKFKLVLPGLSLVYQLNPNLLKKLKR
jgi:hypothetical protein